MASLSLPTLRSTDTSRPVARTSCPSAGIRVDEAHAERIAPSATSRAVRTAQRRACAYVFIANLPHLVEAYGQDFASAASLEIQCRLCAHFVTSAATDMARLRDDCFLLWANAAFVCGTRDLRDLPCNLRNASQPIETLLAVLGAEPVCAKGIAALVQLHADWVEVRAPDQLGTPEVDFVLWTAQPFPDSSESKTDGWRQLYRADMDVAVRVSEALRAEEFSLVWRSVVQADSGASSPLYREGRARITPSRGEPALLALEVVMPCLQRLGLARAFDRIVMRQTLAALRLQSSACLGVSIFAQSTKLDHWWASLLSALDEEPELASRLIIEIMGCATLPDLEAAHNFCVQMQLRGCRIALRDFGGGNDNLADLAAVQSCVPDIVKLDASFLRRARDSAFGRECLQGMISLCAHFVPHVVIDGIERDDDVHIASQAGAQWLQGYAVRGAERKGRIDIAVAGHR